jgi:hypothetical protein
VVVFEGVELPVSLQASSGLFLKAGMPDALSDAH